MNYFFYYKNLFSEFNTLLKLFYNTAIVFIVKSNFTKTTNHTFNKRYKVNNIIIFVYITSTQSHHTHSFMLKTLPSEL